MAAPFSSPKSAATDAPHFRVSTTPHPLYEKKVLSQELATKVNDEFKNPVPTAVWTEEEVLGVQQTHRPVQGLVDAVALGGIKLLRLGFDIISGYLYGRLTRQKILRRVVFLEAAAGIPGMVGGSLRHLRSLRLLRRDLGWIQSLLEEAENERMHMLVFMHLHRPGIFFRGLVGLTQLVFWNVFFFAYLVSPRLCHRFVGYLEEEAVRTYTHILEVLESSDPRDADLRAFAQDRAPEIAIRYWQLRTDATIHDVMLAVRMDEVVHRDVNHAFADVGSNAACPYAAAGHTH